MMEYFVCGDDSAVALQNIGIKCDRCKRVMILKKYSEHSLEFEDSKTVKELIEYAFEKFDYYEPFGMDSVTVFQMSSSR